MSSTYTKWLERADAIYKSELESILDRTADIEDRFYQTVPFGTGGMRGLLGAGTNRMNYHTIRLVAEGLARQIEGQGDVAKARGVVIAYDTRHFSQEFAYETAGVLARHGIQVYIFTESRPTPELSFAVRYLHAIAGVVITASHNPKEYNGFKVYGEDGAQLTPEFADEIVSHMEAVDDIFEIRSMSKDELLASGYCTEILEKIDDAYNLALMSLMQRKDIEKNLSIVYTPLHGSGLVPTVRGLRESGFTNIHTVEEQAVQDGAFPTVSYPNPEEKAAFEMAIEVGGRVGAELLLATDPDADRLGVAVKDGEGYKLLTGNQLGAMILHYLLSTKKENGTLPENGAMVKTIVTSEMGAAIAESFGVKTINTLTGFKFIAEQMAHFEKTGEHTFLFGYEESYGYLAGDFVRDKDAVQIALLTAEMAAYYKNEGKSLLQVLDALYAQYGQYTERLISLKFDGMEGQQKIGAIMSNLRASAPNEFAGLKVSRIEDYKTGIATLADGTEETIELPNSNVLKFILEDGSWICARPSGTEPKCKFYMGLVNQEDSVIDQIEKEILKFAN
ncbi:phospho-sugar mutase [Ureibacillus manganicus]|uniref:Phosphoglucomutase n=1 Tax=Ureibacillus manganicus DSM 26584 TaxID=1384049 RepID=A0A0A3ICQ7_9BACL|nr:phospho-sugar mutase [Ureibacillus manganicus]KGR80603.1 phosphoglucomutase [Ureibacillus manganicus DSM 26584]